jgi:predicted SprT family Zn-dependent metalloprotease
MELQFTESEARAMVIARHREIEALARRLYPTYKRVTDIGFFMKGRAAGTMHYGKNLARYNLGQAMQNDSVARVTVPHEVAHAVAYDVFGVSGHGPKWREVCIALGGDGKRCYSAAERGVVVQKARNVRSGPKNRHFYKYRHASGAEYTVGARHHNALQRGHALSVTVTRTGHVLYKGDWNGGKITQTPGFRSLFA